MESLKKYSAEFSDPLYISLMLYDKCNINFLTENYWSKKRISYMVVMLISFVLFYVALILGVIDNLKGVRNNEVLAEIVPGLMICTEAILKGLCTSLHKKKITHIIERLGSIWRTDDLTETQIARKKELLRNFRTYQTTFVYWSILGSTLYMLAPFFETLVRRLILRQDCELMLTFPSYPFEVPTNWFIYIFFYVFQVYNMFLFEFLYLAPEFLLNGLTSYLAIEFAHLRADFIATTADYCKSNSPENNAKLRSFIGKFTKRHQILTRLSSIHDDAFNEIIFLTIMFVTIIICFLAFTADLAPEFLLNGLTSYLAIEFAHLRADFIATTADYCKSNSPENNAKLRSFIGKFTKRHQILTRLSSIHDDAFNEIIFLTIMFVTIIICFLAFTADISPYTTTKVIHCMGASEFLAHSFMLAYYGELLSDESGGIADEVYNSLWYNCDLYNQKSIILLILRAQKECGLTSLRYAPVTLKTFTKVVSTTWSYFSLTRGLYKGE